MIVVEVDGIVGVVQEEVVMVTVEHNPKSPQGSHGYLVHGHVPVAVQSGKQLFESKHVGGQVPSK